jgi:hypothetical protein
MKITKFFTERNTLDRWTIHGIHGTTKRLWTCTICAAEHDLEDDGEDDARNHLLSKHHIPAAQDGRFLLFTSEVQGYTNLRPYDDLVWTGPGWYGWVEDHAAWLHVDEIEERHREKIRQLTDEIEDMRGLK